MQKKKFTLCGSEVAAGDLACNVVKKPWMTLREIIEDSKRKHKENIYYKNSDWRTKKIFVQLKNGDQKEFTYEELDKILP